MTFKTIIKNIPKWLLLGIVLTTIISSFDGVILSAVISNVTRFTRNSTISDVLIYISVSLLAWFCIYLAMSLKQILVNKFIKLMNVLLKSNFIYSQLREPNFETDAANNISKIFNDFKLVETNYFSTFFELCSSILMSAVSAIYILTLNIPVGLIFIAFSALPIISSKLFSKILNESSLNWQSSSSTFLSKVTDLFRGMRTIKTYLADKSMYEDSNNYLEQSETAYQKMNNMQAWAMFASAILSVISFILPLGIGLTFIINGQLNAAQIIAIFLASDRVVGPLRNAAQYLNEMKTTQSIRQNLKLQTITFPDSPQVANSDTPDLKLDNVNFKYSNNKEILKNLTITFPFGSKTMITGNSGIGKSTLLDLIQGFIKPNSGKIYISNGTHTITDINKSGMVAYIEQNPILFNDTLKFNLTLGEPFSDEQCLAVLKTVNLNTELGTEALTKTYGEGGKDLSGGQRQRVEIARALLHNQKIILVDEATSALDTHMSEQVQQILEQLNSTIIEISHHYDQITHKGEHFVHYVLADKSLKIAND